MEWYYVWWHWLTSKRVARVCQHQLSFLFHLSCCGFVAANKDLYNKLCAWRHNKNYAPARCRHASVHLQSIDYTPYACGAQRALCHEYSWSTGYDHGVVHINHVMTRTANHGLHGDLDLWPFNPESGVWVICDVGYLCADFGLPRPLYSRLRPDVRDRRHTDRQTSDKNIV